MTEVARSTGTFMLSKEIDILMAERARAARWPAPRRSSSPSWKAATLSGVGRHRGRDPRRKRQRAVRGHAQATRSLHHPPDVG